jgi:cytochrome c peroxidase
MRSLHYFMFLVAGIIIAHACDGDKKNRKPAEKSKELVQIQLDSLNGWLTYEFIPLAEKSDNVQALQRSFFKGRKIYKRAEWGLEYFYPSTAKSINGAPLPEIEFEEHQVTEPSGFQVIEEHLFPSFIAGNRSELVRESNKLKSLLGRMQTLWEGLECRDDQVFDAVRIQLARIITLGISGFDNPVALNGINEVEPSLKGIAEVLKLYGRNRESEEQIAGAIKFANTARSFDEFNRMDFITDHINPLSRTIFQWQKELKIPVLTGISAFRGDAATLFDEAAFDINYFTPDANSWMSSEKTELGRRLFYDPILSESMKISCASCHKPEKAFTDGLAKSVATGSDGFLARNTPTLINAGYQHGQFYDLRSAFLEDQVKDVIQNKDEVHGSLELASKRMMNDPGYTQAFMNAFPGTDSINPAKITIVLASYIRSLAGFRSSFDQYMRGDKTRMDRDAVEGFNLFMGKAKCGTCHFMPLFNGTVPPAFTTTESEVLGVPEHSDGKKLDKDPGRYAVYKIPEFLSAFKTPSVRNVSLTAPYMHNGVYQTLEEVMEFYNKGGGRGLGLEVTYQTLPEDPLNLSKEKQRKIISFLGTLTDTSSAR